MKKIEDISSPCNGDCLIDQETEFCKGCFRTMDEIANWFHMKSKEKSEVLDKTRSRMLDYLK